MDSLMIFIWVIGWVIASSAVGTEALLNRDPWYSYVIGAIVMAFVWPIYLGALLALKE